MLSALAMACALAAAVGPARAAASTTQESMLQDDNQLVYASPSHVKQVLTELAALGVERIRVSVIWSLVAPDPLSTTPPDFDATDPAAYPAGAWDRYDTLVTDAAAAGLSVDFNVTAPAPAWATQRLPADLGSKFANVYAPSAIPFGQFVQAVGKRYSGTYVPPGATGTTTTVTTPPTVLGITLPTGFPGTTSTTTTTPPPPLPRVNYWEIWNEPNEAGWLTPQWRRGPQGPATPGHKAKTNWIEESPVLYRHLLDQAWSALAATGHGSDTILIGDTSAKGSQFHGALPALPPIMFLRGLYCVGSTNRPLRGTAAAELACPTNASTGAFVAEHPALFAATGYADHPYSFTTAPGVKSTNPNWATMADLPRLERFLNGVFATYGESKPGGVPLYLTEYGYKSNPPNPYVKITQAEQAEYINEGEYMAWREPYVRVLSQFELVDAGPQTTEPLGSPLYWGTFQTGLVSINGQAKPSYYAYRIPIWLPDPRVGPQVKVWGQLRPADRSGPQLATIQYEPKGASSFSTLEQVESSAQGFIFTTVGVTGRGSMRLAWADPATGQVDHSRIVPVT
jgi:hypothetical protein